eukprot:scaffold66917_cov60-Phaeocystis_antarctica.AAC.2
MGTKRVVPLVTSSQYTDPQEWHGPVGGFLADQFWECYLAEAQLETVADNICQRVMLYKCEHEVWPPSTSCRHPLPRPHWPKSAHPFTPFRAGGAGIDERLKEMKQQAANLRVQRGPVTSY